MLQVQRNFQLIEYPSVDINILLFGVISLLQTKTNLHLITEIPGGVYPIFYI